MPADRRTTPEREELSGQEGASRIDDVMPHWDDDDEPVRRSARRGGEAAGGGAEGQAEGRCKPLAGQPAAVSEAVPHGEMPSATGRTANCGENPFGERDMLDVPKVRKVLERRVRKKREELGWFDLTDDDLEEAVAWAILDLYDYWWEIPSSLSGSPERNLNYALWRGLRVAVDYLWNERAAREGERATRPPAWATGEREPDSERSAEVRRAVEALPDEEREAVLVTHWRCLSYREAALEIGVSHMTVSRRHRRAVERLRKQLSTDAPCLGVTAFVNTE